MHNTTRVTPMDGVSASNTGTTMHKQDMHECTSYMSFHYCQHIGQPFSNFGTAFSPYSESILSNYARVSVPTEKFY